MRLLDVFRIFVLSVLFLGVTPALCMKNPFSDGQKEFQKMKEKFDYLYQIFWDRCPGCDYEVDKKLRIFEQYEDKEWVKKNIIRVVEGQFNKDRTFLVKNLSASKFRDIMRTRNALRENKFQQKMNEHIKDYKLYRPLERAPQGFQVMYKQLGELTSLVEPLGRIIEALNRWTVEPPSYPNENVQHLDGNGLPMDLKDYLRALLERWPNNKWWTDFVIAMDRWHDMYYVGSNDCWFRHRGDMNMDRVYGCAANPMWFDGRVKVTILKQFLVQHAMTAGLHHDGMTGSIRWTGLRKSGSRKPQVWTPDWRSGKKDYQVHSIMKVRKAIQGEGKNRGFGMSDLMLKGLTDISAWNEVAKKMSMAKRPPPRVPERVGFGTKLKNFFGIKSGEKNEGKEGKEIKLAEPKKTSSNQEKEKNEVKAVKEIGQAEIGQAVPKKFFNDDKEEMGNTEEGKPIERPRVHPKEIFILDNDEKNEAKEEFP